MMKTGSRFAHIWKKVRENLSRLSFNEFKLATNKTLVYDIPPVKLKMMCTARFWIAESARDFGVILDAELTMSAHVTALCRSGFF